MKLLVIFEKSIFPPDEGIRKIVDNLLKQLSKKHRVFFLTSRDSCNIDSSITILLNKFFLSKKLFSILQQISPEAIIYIPYSSATFNSFLRVKILKLFSKKSKVVMIALQARYINVFFRKILSFLWPDLVLFSSKKASKVMAKSQRMGYFYPGVSLEKFHPTDSVTKQNLRKKYEIPLNKFVFLHVGHIKKRRNVEILLRVAESDNFLLIVSSSCSKQDLPLSRKLSSKDNIRIIDSYFENIEEAYQLADCYVFPVRDYKGAIDFPLSVLEAMACNLPVITTRFGGLLDKFKEDAKAGFIYFSNRLNLKEKVTLIKAINPKEFGTRDLIGNFSWNSVIDRLIDTIKEHA